MGRPSREVEIAAAAFGIETRSHRDRLQQGRLSGTVFADKKSYRLVKAEVGQTGDRRYGEWVDIVRRNIFMQQADLNEEISSVPCCVHFSLALVLGALCQVIELVSTQGLNKATLVRA